MEIYHQPSFS